MAAHPPFRDSAGPVPENATEYDLAHRHAGMIREAWARAGHEIEVRVVEHHGAYLVRMPGLVNGLPARVDA